VVTEPRNRKMVVNVSAQKLHWYPAWEECNIDDAGEDVIVMDEESVAKSAELSEFTMCKICESKPR
jgi:hypothetical protein